MHVFSSFLPLPHKDEIDILGYLLNWNTTKVQITKEENVGTHINSEIRDFNLSLINAQRNTISESVKP